MHFDWADKKLKFESIVVFPFGMAGPTPCKTRTFSVTQKTPHGVVRHEIIRKNYPLKTVRKGGKLQMVVDR